MKPTDPDFADRLRAIAAKQHATVIYGSTIELLADAVAIADDCARADIECNSLWQDIDGRRWFTLDWEGAAADENEAMLRKSVTYLERRGRLDRDVTGRIAFK
jgi:hypothetical protein